MYWTIDVHKELSIVTGSVVRFHFPPKQQSRKILRHYISDLNPIKGKCGYVPGIG